MHSLSDFLYRLWPAVLLTVVLMATACTQQPSPTAPAPAAFSPADSATVTPQANATPLPLTSSALEGAFSKDRTLAHNKQLADTIGSRPAGEQSERDAAEYIAAQLRLLGYQTETPPFTFRGYDRGEASMTVNSGSGTAITPEPLYFSTGGDISGSIVAAGIGRADDMPAGLSGKVALIERGAITFTEKVTNAARAGATAAVIYNNVAGAFEGSLQDISTIPAVGITQAHGQQLLALIRQGDVSVRLNVTSGQSEFKSQNVVTRIPGSTCKLLIGGHYDSVPAGPGANDNASGTATMLELARVFKDHALKLGVCFAAFGGEELGLWGSRRYVEAMSAEEKAAMGAMVNLDMVGVGTEWRIAASRALIQKTQDALDAHGGSGVVREAGGENRGSGSDHASFIRAGIPSVHFYRSNDPNYHSPEDKTVHIDPAALEAAGKMSIKLVLSLLISDGAAAP